MANIAGSRKAQTLTRLLRRINRGDDPKLLRREAHQLLPSVEPKDIATAEQILIDNGYSVQLVQLLSATFMLMAIPEEQSANPKTWLPANHILQTVMVEHDVLRCFLADLDDVVGTIGYLYHLTDVSSEFRKLAHIIEHLNAMKRHIEREDDVIFPYLRKHGRISLCQAVQGDHINITTEIDNLAGLIVLFNEVSFEQFKAGLIATTRRLRTMMQEHLAQEDEILYPIALGIINDAEIWEKMKAFCDEVGYCGIHL
ncbi:MAG: DUF438 domain-containing protein [Planctomycetota bacterium]|jgi:DUF438 domain-containing protein